MESSEPEYTDSERCFQVEMLLRGDYRELSRPAASSTKTVKSYLKKRREADAASTAASDAVEATRHELVPGEVCAICQEDMDASQSLTFCRKGCGNNFHIDCSASIARPPR